MLHFQPATSEGRDSSLQVLSTVDMRKITVALNPVRAAGLNTERLAYAHSLQKNNLRSSKDVAYDVGFLFWARCHDLLGARKETKIPVWEDAPVQDAHLAGLSFPLPSRRLQANASDEKQGWRIFTSKEVLAATQNFSNDNKLGEGGFGSVYWGQLQGGSQIAVKRLKVWTSKAEMEFAVEVEILGRARHKNLLSLRGYCAEGQERLIIYDFMPNLSLLSHLHGQFTSEGHLDWRRRMRIALGSAEGIAYLHHYAIPHIIHRDVKASNILLDANFEAHVADFGFAKLIPEGVSHVTTRVKGTLGYLAPEYALWGKVSESCDVYSFGILLFELISGRKPIEKLGSGQKRTIVEWAGPLVYEGKVDELVDPKLKGQFDEAELRRVVYVAAMCAQSSPEKRPTMREVVESLKGEGLFLMPSAEHSQEERTSVTLEAVNYGEKLLAEDDDDANDDNVSGNQPRTRQSRSETAHLHPSK